MMKQTMWKVNWMGNKKKICKLKSTWNCSSRFKYIRGASVRNRDVSQSQRKFYITRRSEYFDLGPFPWWIVVVMMNILLTFHISYSNTFLCVRDLPFNLGMNIFFDDISNKDWKWWKMEKIFTNEKYVVFFIISASPTAWSAYQCMYFLWFSDVCMKWNETTFQYWLCIYFPSTCVPCRLWPGYACVCVG